MSDQLCSLRISMARVAQAAGVSLAPIGCADDAAFHDIRHAALMRPHGWNTLAVAVIAAIEKAGRERPAPHS